MGEYRGAMFRRRDRSQYVPRHVQSHRRRFYWYVHIPNLMSLCRVRVRVIPAIPRLLALLSWLMLLFFTLSASHRSLLWTTIVLFDNLSNNYTRTTCLFSSDSSLETPTTMPNIWTHRALSFSSHTRLHKRCKLFSTTTLPTTLSRISSVLGRN